MLASDRRFSRPSPLVAFLGVLVLFAAVQSSFRPVSAQATIAFVQVNSATPQSPSTTVAVPYTGAQTAGNLNVVVVGWNDATAQVQSVVDYARKHVSARGRPNRSRRARRRRASTTRPTSPRRRAGGNTVTVTFSPAAAFADIRIAEYRGIATVNPVDVTAARAGQQHDQQQRRRDDDQRERPARRRQHGRRHITTRPGTVFTSRIITSPDGDILEDRIVTRPAATARTAPFRQPAGGSCRWSRSARRSPGDTQPPTAPGTPVLTVVSSTQINLTWTAATDNVGVTGYRVERCAGAGCTTFAQIAAPTTTSFNDTGLTRVDQLQLPRARDRRRGQSRRHTPPPRPPPHSGADTQPPTAPGTPVLTVVSSTQINLSWTAATDNVGVTGYFVERCAGASCSNFAQIGTPATDELQRHRPDRLDELQLPRARDRRGEQSRPVLRDRDRHDAGGADTQPPTAPGTPVLTVVSSTQINLTWTAATDNVGVTGYRRALRGRRLHHVRAGRRTGQRRASATPALTRVDELQLSRPRDRRGEQPERRIPPPRPPPRRRRPDTQPPTAPGTPVRRWCRSADQSDVDRRDRQRRRHRLSRRTLPGRRLHDVRADRGTRQRPASATSALDGVDELQLSGARDRCRQQPERVFRARPPRPRRRRRTRSHRRRPARRCDGRLEQPDQSDVDRVDRQRRA